MFLDFDTNIYSKYIGRIKFLESQKEQRDLIFSQEEAYIFKKSYIKKYIQVADPAEEWYRAAKSKVEKILRQQYTAWSKVYEIFDQLNPIITNHMKLTINQFLRQETKTKGEYTKFVVELKSFKQLWLQIPTTVRFPLFSVTWEEVREMLVKRIDEMLEKVYIDIENDIIKKVVEIDK